MTELLDTLTELHLSGISYIASVKSPEGAYSISLTPQQLIDYYDSPDEVIAKKLRVSESDYLQWQEEDFCVRCSALTNLGERCKKPITGGYMVSPGTWAELHGSYCSFHTEGSA